MSPCLLHECGVHAQSPGYMRNAAHLLYHYIQTQRQTSIQDYMFNNETCNVSRITIQESHTGSQMSQDTTLHSTR